MKRFIAYCSIIAMALSAFAAPSFAQMKKKAKAKKVAGESYSAPWGMAGCGLWTFILKDKSQGSQLGVWLLRHAIFDSQTSAISSGTSNCVASGSNVAEEKEVFISVNIAQLSKEAAQGSGDHLNALAEIYGCPHNAFANLSQSRYGEIYSTSEANQIHQNYLKEVKAHHELAQSCARAS